MNRRILFVCSFLIIIFLISTSTSIFAENSQKFKKEYIFLLDTSGSMVGQANGVDIFDKVKNSMYDKIDQINITNIPTNIILMTFDQGIKSKWSRVISSESDKELVKDKIRQISAKGDVTWITHGLKGALSKLEELRKNETDYTHWQYLYMFTDAINTGPGVPAITFEDIKDEFRLKSGEHHQNLYIFTLGVPTHVVNSLREEFEDTNVKIDTTAKGKEPLEAITVFFQTDKKNYKLNEKINLKINSNDIQIAELNVKKLLATVIRPNNTEESFYFKKFKNSFFYQYSDTNIPGNYIFKLNTTKTEFYKIFGSKDLIVKVNKPKPVNVELKLQKNNYKLIKDKEKEILLNFKIINITKNCKIRASINGDEKIINLESPMKEFTVTYKPENFSEGHHQALVKFSFIGKRGTINPSQFKVTYNIFKPNYTFWYILIALIVLIIILVLINKMRPSFTGKLNMSKEGVEITRALHGKKAIKLQKLQRSWGFPPSIKIHPTNSNKKIKITYNKNVRKMIKINGRAVDTNSVILRENNTFEYQNISITYMK